MTQAAVGLTERSLASRVRSIEESSTVAMSERVRRMRAAGTKILNLASGDPNLQTPPEVVEAAERSMREGNTHYGPAQGLPGLRKAISMHLNTQAFEPYEPEEIIITPGGKFALYVAIQALINAGDEAIILDPAWVSYSPSVLLAGGVPIRLPAPTDLPLPLLKEALTPRTKIILVNSPVNPTGRVIPRHELEQLFSVAAEHNVWILFDEVYSQIVFEDHPFTPFYALEGAKSRTLVINSLSKTYGMTGWRLGYLAAPKEFIAPALKIMQHSIYCVPGFVQVAGEAALSLPQARIEATRAKFQGRRDNAVRRLNQLPGIRCSIPQGTFYVFPFVGGNDVAVAEAWLEGIGLAVVPGSAFGTAGKGHIRMALTCADEQLGTALDRLEEYYESHPRPHEP